MATDHFGVFTFWCVYILACLHFGVFTFWRVYIALLARLYSNNV